jgi:hypothetical protein
VAVTYALLADVSTRLGRPITLAAEIAQVNAWLGDVEASIVSRFTRAGLVLADQIALDDPAQAIVVRVEAESVIRRILRPRPDITSTTRSVDDGTITDRWEGQTSEFEWLTDADWSDLMPFVTSGAFSTRPGFEADTVTSEAWL